MQILTPGKLSMIHDASMNILVNAGVRFYAQEALEIFIRHGFRTDGNRVLITEKEIAAALATVPSRFSVRARNPAHNVSMGENDFVFLPTGGAPHVANAVGKRRPATLADYHDCCKLVQTSDQLDMNGWSMVQPTDIPPQVAHLDMLLANISLCDKAYVGSATSRQAAQDSLEIAALLWGGKEKLKLQPAMVTIVNPTSPLKYSVEEAESIIEMAHFRQPLVITNLVMSGTSGPVSLPGSLVLANAEILAGLVLSQLVGPGTPVVYGSVSAPTDMKTVVSAVGAPEAVMMASAVPQLARFYHLPSRTGGMLTNSHCPDAQAAAEGTLMMSTAVRNGANFIVHACGQLGAYISMSFEKWLIDEEVCRMIRSSLKAFDITAESIDVDTIKTVGSDGNYLEHPTTLKYYRSLYQSNLFARADYQSWLNNGARNVTDVAAETLPKRLAKYTRPPIDEGLEQALIEFVTRRKKEFFESTSNSSLKN